MKLEIQTVDIDQVKPPSVSPCTVIDPEFIAELAASITEHGLNVPILVKRLNEDYFEIIDGQKRWAACKRLGHTQIIVTVREIKDEDEQFILAFVLNLQRHTLTPLEIAQGIEHMVQMEYSQREIGKMLGKSQGWVQVRHQLLQLEPETLKLAGPETPSEFRLSQTKAYILTDLPKETQIKLAKEISDKKLSVTDARRLVATKVRDENIPLKGKNTSRLFLIEDLKKFSQFLTRTNEYLDVFLGTEAKKFGQLFDGVNIEQVDLLMQETDNAVESMTALKECLNTVRKNKLSTDTTVNVSPKKIEEIDAKDEDFDKVMELTEDNLRTASTMRLLSHLGLGRYDLYGKRKRNKRNLGLWTRDVNHLEILEKAKTYYKKRIKDIHPDVSSENGRDAMLLNVAWATVEERFKLHGFELAK